MCALLYYEVFFYQSSFAFILVEPDQPSVGLEAFLVRLAEYLYLIVYHILAAFCVCLCTSG